MIIRRRHTANFTTIGNALFDDERLAADELGILAFLRSKPADWEVRRPALMKRFRIGRDAMRRIVSNWMRAGWCDAKKERRPDGTFIIVYEIRDDRGPELSDEEIRRALSPGSGEAATEDQAERPPEICADASQVGELCSQPDTSQPVLAHPSTADPYLVDSNILNTESPRKDSNQIEREYARAKEKHVATLPEFKRRYPTTASDDQTRIDSAWFKLSPEDGLAALAGIAPFLERLKRDGRKHPPSAWKYLEEKRWTLLEVEKLSNVTELPKIAADSPEGRAWLLLHRIAGAGEPAISNGQIALRKPMPPRAAAFVNAPAETEWCFIAETETNKLGAWRSFLGTELGMPTGPLIRDRSWRPMRPDELKAQEGLPEAERRRAVMISQRGFLAPWQWPPRKDGTLSTTAPDIGCSEEELADFK